MSVTLCAGSSIKKKEKRGIFQEHSYAAPLAAAPLQANFAELPAPQLFAPAYEAQPLLAAPQLSLAPFQQFQQFAAPLPAAGYAIQAAPAQVQTIIKKIAVPQERIIPIDNPIYTPVERPVPIDNPVPVLKIVEQNVPVHVDHPIAVPVVKEIQVPQPYVHKVKLVLQKVFVEQPPAPRKTIIIQEAPRQQQQGWGWD